MASLQTLHLAHLPPDLAVHVALYTDLQNASFLRDQLLQGNPDFEYALIDAGVILSAMHVLAAVFRAANDYLNGRLKSRNVHSEIVFSLGANNNIAQSLRTFGITPTTTSLLAIKLSTSPSITAATVSAHLASSIQGTAVAFSDVALATTVDVGRVRKLYKLGGVGVGEAADGKGKGNGKVEGKGRRKRMDGREEGSGGGGGVGAGGEVGAEGEGEGKGEGKREREREMKELEVAVLGLMALRGAV